jgi:hypothetical protein
MSLRRTSFALLLAAALPAAAQNAYPNGKTFNCNFTRANGTTGQAVVSFQLSGGLGTQQGTMTNQIVGGGTFTPPIQLTKPRFEGPKKVWDFKQLDNNVTCRLSTWKRTVEWDNCSNGNRQSCVEAGTIPASVSAATAPYLIIKAVQLREDHEDDFFRGSPEFEIFQADPGDASCTTAPCYKARSTTKLLFDGNTRVDDYGRTIRLEDVNDTGRWYNLSTPIYLPFQVGMGLLAMEDDDEAGKLKRSTSFSITFHCAPNSSSDSTFKASAPASLIPLCWPEIRGDIKALWGGGDDDYNKLYIVTHGLDQGREDIIDLGEWLLKVTLGY